VSDLTAKEQANVRAALRFLRVRAGRLDTFAKALRYERATLRRVLAGSDGVSPAMAFRVARMASVGVDDVLTGKYPPPGTCPHCGATSPAS
jgi:plasmid maintenance system antidote protein VapI